AHRDLPPFPTRRSSDLFGDSYLKHLEVLGNVGMTSIEPVDFQGTQIVPIQFLKALLPDPASLGPRTKGRTCIGCFVTGIKDGERSEEHTSELQSRENLV